MKFRIMWCMNDLICFDLDVRTARAFNQWSPRLDLLENHPWDGVDMLSLYHAPIHSGVRNNMWFEGPHGSTTDSRLWYRIENL